MSEAYQRGAGGLKSFGGWYYLCFSNGSPSTWLGWPPGQFPVEDKFIVQFLRATWLLKYWENCDMTKSLGKYFIGCRIASYSFGGTWCRETQSIVRCMGARDFITWLYLLVKQTLHKNQLTYPMELYKVEKTEALLHYFQKKKLFIHGVTADEIGI